MIPKVLISSMFYNPKTVKESVRDFVKNYGFDVVLSKDDIYTYEKQGNVQPSILSEIKSCHLIILIIGKDETDIDRRLNLEKKEKTYREYFEAIIEKQIKLLTSSNIKFLVYIDDNVYQEYRLCKENTKETVEKMNLSHLVNKKVIESVDLIHSSAKYGSIQELEKDLQTRFSGYFYEGLSTNIFHKMQDSVSELSRVTHNLNHITTESRKLKQQNYMEYEKIEEILVTVIIELYGEILRSLISFAGTMKKEELDKRKLNDFTRFIYRTFNTIDERPCSNGISGLERLKFEVKKEVEVRKKINDFLFNSNYLFKVEEFNVFEMKKILSEKINPFINNEEYETRLYSKFDKVIKEKITALLH